MGALSEAAVLGVEVAGPPVLSCISPRALSEPQLLRGCSEHSETNAQCARSWAGPPQAF